MAQVAIITASDSGIGKECALLLAQQGFDIGITWHSDEEGAKDTAREVVSHGVRAEIVQLDLGNLPEGALALEKLIQRLGPTVRSLRAYACCSAPCRFLRSSACRL